MKNTLDFNINKNLVKVIVASLLIAGIFCSFTSNASSLTDGADIFYRSISVQPGDTLWGLAQESSDNLELSTKEIVSLLKSLNDLDNDNIYTGDTLIIPYKK